MRVNKFIPSNLNNEKTFNDLIILKSFQNWFSCENRIISPLAEILK